MREGQYKKEIFQELTGKSLEELEKEWLATLKQVKSPLQSFHATPQRGRSWIQPRSLPAGIVVVSEQAHHDDRDPDEDTPSRRHKRAGRS